MSGLDGLKMRVFQNQSNPVGTNEWIQKVKLWNAFIFDAFCMSFQNKSTPAFLLMKFIPLFKKMFYCEIFVRAEAARLHTV